MELKKIGGNNIVEIFLAGPQEFSGSGRISPEQSKERFTGLLQTIHKGGLKTNLVINSICGGADWYSSNNTNKLVNYLKELHEIYGLEAVTVANPIHIKIIRKALPSIEICASVLSDINTVERARFIEMPGSILLLLMLILTGTWHFLRILKRQPVLN